MVTFKKLNKKYNTQKARKTSQGERMNYKYEDANGNIYVIEPGEDGITEADIKLLHSLDDAEVYNNHKNWKPNRTKEEKEKIKEYKKRFIENFKEEYGYEPSYELIQDNIDEKFPRNYNLSLDAELVNSDKSALENKIVKEQEFEWSEEVENVLDTLTEKQRMAIEEHFANGLKKQEVAKLLGISNAAVTKLFTRAFENIKKHYKKL